MSSLPILAGVVSTLIFAASTLPMLVKAYRTRDLSSYSMGNIGLANLGNAVHSVYVFSLPPGPLWVLHSFYLTSTALMLVWFVRYGDLRGSTHVARVADAQFARRGAPARVPTVAP
jgi:hypothetical protein